MSDSAHAGKCPKRRVKSLARKLKCIYINWDRKKSKAKTKVPPPESVRQPTFDTQGKCTNPLTVAEHAKHVENTRFIPFILESSGVYGKQALQFVQEVSKWAQSQGHRPDHFEENMRRCIGISLMKSNCDLMSRAAHVQGTLRGNRWTRANTRQRTAAAMMMQFDIFSPFPLWRTRGAIIAV